MFLLSAGSAWYCISLPLEMAGTGKHLLTLIFNGMQVGRKIYFWKVKKQRELPEEVTSMHHTDVCAGTKERSGIADHPSTEARDMLSLFIRMG